MDGDESGLTSYYHHHQQQQPLHHHPTTTNGGVFSDPNNHNHNHNHQHNQSTIGGHFNTSSEPIVYPQQPQPLPVVVVQQETVVKRKRGRPRKYGGGGAPETVPQSTAASPSSAAKKLNTTTSSVPLPSSSSPPRKKDPKKNQLLSLGNAGQNFIPHIITVTAGEDVTQKIMSFTQQRKRAVCILSASGSISNASLRQPATLGGNVTYEGRFEILSLSGSFLHTETEGGSSRTGGLSVCLSATDGRIIGGGVGGPLKAAGPVQVIIGSFVVDNKENNIDPKFETSSSKLPQVIGGTFSSVVYGSPDASGRISGRGNNDHQNIGGSNFMLQSRGMHSIPSQSTDWRDSSGLAEHGACQSSEDGDDGTFQH